MVDNSQRECKNTYMFAYLAWLVSTGALNRVELSMHPVVTPTMRWTNVGVACQSPSMPMKSCVIVSSWTCYTDVTAHVQMWNILMQLRIRKVSSTPKMTHSSRVHWSVRSIASLNHSCFYSSGTGNLGRNGPRDKYVFERNYTYWIQNGQPLIFRFLPIPG